MTGAPGPCHKNFVDLQMPEDLCEGYGYPQITHEDKRMILGGNMAGLLGIDVPTTIKQLSGTKR
jgi:hypothetical protein